MFKTQKEVNRAFLDFVEGYNLAVKPVKRLVIIRGSHNDQNCDTRSAYCDFIDGLNKDGLISDKLASRVSFSWNGIKK